MVESKSVSEPSGHELVALSGRLNIAKNIMMGYLFGAVLYMHCLCQPTVLTAYRKLNHRILCL